MMQLFSNRINKELTLELSFWRICRARNLTSVSGGGSSEATWCLRTAVGCLKTPPESWNARTHFALTSPWTVLSFPACRNLSNLHLEILFVLAGISCTSFVKVFFSNRFTHTAHQGFHMCWMQISVNFLRKDGTKTLDDLEVVHFGRKMPIMFASKPVPSRGVLRKAPLHEMCRFEFDNCLQNDYSSVNSLLILFEKKVTSSSKAKIQNLGRVS